MKNFAPYMRLEMDAYDCSKGYITSVTRDGNTNVLVKEYITTPAVAFDKHTGTVIQCGDKKDLEYVFNRFGREITGNQRDYALTDGGMLSRSGCLCLLYYPFATLSNIPDKLELIKNINDIALSHKNAVENIFKKVGAEI